MPIERPPQMNYREPKVDHNCWDCDHSKVTNAGAIYPGLECTIMEEKFQAAGIEDGNDQVNDMLGTCDLHTALFTQVAPDRESETVGDET